MNPEKLKKLQALKAAGAGRSAGQPRRKKKIVHTSAGTDSRKLVTTLQKNGVNSITGVDEVNMFRNDDKILHFANPKVSTAQDANTMAVSGRAELKEVHELIPGIVQQLGPENMDLLKRLADQMQQQSGASMAAQRAAQQTAEDGDDDDDDDVPDLVENFEEAANVD